MTDNVRHPQHNRKPIAAQKNSIANEVGRSTADYLQPTKLEVLLQEPSITEKLSPPERGGAQNNTKPTPDQCAVQVRFNPLGPGYYHGYILTTDSRGTEYFRGGPGRQAGERPDIGKSGTLISGAGGAISQSAGTDEYTISNSGNSLSAGSGPGGEGENLGLFGSIVVDSGAYNSDALDWQENDVPTVTVAQYAGNCDSVETQLRESAAAITQKFTPYNPLASNSNSVARELLDAAGFPDVESPVWAPGWHTELGPK